MHCPVLLACTGTADVTVVLRSVLSGCPLRSASLNYTIHEVLPRALYLSLFNILGVGW